MNLSQNNLDILHYSIQGLQPGIIPGLIYKQSIIAPWNSAYFTLTFFYIQFHSSTAITITILCQDYHSKIWGILPNSFLWLCNVSKRLVQPTLPQIIKSKPSTLALNFLESKSRIPFWPCFTTFQKKYSFLAKMVYSYFFTMHSLLGAF